MGAGLGLLHKGLEVDPAFVVSEVNIARFEAQQGLPEQSMRDARAILPMLSGEAGAQSGRDPQFVGPTSLLICQSRASSARSASGPRVRGA